MLVLVKRLSLKLLKPVFKLHRCPAVLILVAKIVLP